MSESAFANLLQFESTDTQARPSQSVLNPPQFGEYPSAAQAVLAESTPAPATTAPEAPEDDAAALAREEAAARAQAVAAEKELAIEQLQAARAAAETAVQQLQDVYTQVQEEGRKQTANMMRAMAEELFPALSREFLGHEIARHIPDLLPRSVVEVTISTSVDVSLVLEEALAKATDMPSSYFLKVEPTLGDGAVQVAWDHGGYDFDFKALTTACKARYLPDLAEDKDAEHG